MSDGQRVLISDAVSPVCRSILEQRGLLVTDQGSMTDDILNMIPAFDGLIVRSATKVTAEIISAGGRLKAIGRAGTGVDNIDVPAATEKGIAVMNCLGANTLSAAEHTFALAISLARQIPAGHHSVRAGKWERAKFKGAELMGKTWGIVGLGKIGIEIARRAQAFGMTTIAHDPLIAPEVFETNGVEAYALTDLFKRSDFVSLHVPLLPATRYLIGAELFAMAKKELRIINTSRGGIIDEAALYDALKSGRIAGAALDVFENEPPVGSPLHDLDNVITTPHIGASTAEAQERVAEGIAIRIADFLQEGKATDIVNPEVLEN